MKKFILPKNAWKQDSDIFLGKRTHIFIDGKCGWEVLDEIAKANEMTIPELAIACDANVAHNGVMVDTECFMLGV